MNLLEQARQVIQKSFTTTDLATGGGLLAPQQAAMFIRMLKMQPNLLRAVRLVPLKGPTDRIDRILFPGRILHAVTTEGTGIDAAKYAKPTSSKVEMSAQEFQAVVPLTYNALQDSIEGGREVRGNEFENTVFNLIAEAVALDIENYALNSDTASADPDFAKFDGFFKLAQASHVYNHGGAALSKAFFKKTFLEMPQQYRQKKKEMMWVISSNMEIEWNDELVDAGYNQWAQGVAWADTEVNSAWGIPMLVSHAVTAESGASSNLGKTLLTHPKNCIIGIWRNITMEVDRDIINGQLIVVVRVRFDAKMEQVEGSVVGNNVAVK